MGNAEQQLCKHGCSGRADGLHEYCGAATCGCGTVRITRDSIPSFAPCTVQLPEGWSAEVRVEYDEDMGSPWTEHDGHGPVRELYTRLPSGQVQRGARDKRPGERQLDDGRGEVIGWYDFAEAVRIARRDGWDTDRNRERCKVCQAIVTSREAHDAEWNGGRAAGLGHAFTPYTAGEIAARAAEADYQRMQGWCRGDWGGGWSWVGVVVRLLDAEGAEVAEGALWGIESDGDYWREVAAEQINELAAGLCLPNYADARDADAVEVPNG